MMVKRERGSESSSALMNLLLHVTFVYFFFSYSFYSLSASVLGDILWPCTRTHAQLSDPCFYQPHITLALVIPVQSCLACFCEWARLWLMALVAEPYSLVAR